MTGISAERRQSLTWRIISSSAGYVLLRTLTGGLGALASLLLFRLLGPDQAGRFSLTLAIAMTVAALAGLGFHGTLARFVPERPREEGAGLYRRSLRFVALSLVVASAGIAILCGLGVVIPEEARRVAPLLILAMAVYTVYTNGVGMLQGRGRFRIIPQLDFGANFLAKLTAIGVILVVPGYVAAFSAHTAVQLVMVVVTFYLLRSAWSRPEIRFKRTETVFGRFVLAGEVVRVLVHTANLYVLRFMLLPVDVGIFAAGSRLARVVEQLVIVPINAPLLYYFSHPESASMRYRIVEQATRVVGSLMGVAALIVAMLAELIVRVFLGEAYAESAAVARIYASHSLGMGLLIFFVPLYTSENKPQYTIVQNLMIFLINLVLAVILVPSYGPVGAAVATVVAVALVVVGAAFFVKRRFAVEVRGAVALILTLYGGCYALLELGHPLVAAVIYVAALFPLRLLRVSDYHLIQRARRAKKGVG
jgi:PST family polysaccharide transporter